MLPLSRFWRARPPKPRLSMVVATYNVAPYIAAFFGSLLAQTDGLDALEVIVVDDGSTDDSGRIAKTWAARFPKTIRVITQDNQGVAAARNAGLAQATGDWVCFPDPDDFLSPDYLARMRAEMLRPQARPLLAVAAPLIMYHEKTGRFTNTHPLRYRFRKGPQRRSSSRMGRFLLPHTSSTFMRRADITACNLSFDSRIRPSFEDAHFIIRLVMRCPDRTVSFLTKPAYYYRKRQAGGSLVDGVKRDPRWYGPHLEHAYLSLLQESRDRHGTVPQDVQANVLFSLIGKLRYLTGPEYDPAILDPDAQRMFLQRLSEVMAYFDTKTLQQINVPGLVPLHRQALLALYKEDATSAPRQVALQEAPATDPAGLCLRWDTGGAAQQATVRLEIDGTPCPGPQDRTQHRLFDIAYAQSTQQYVTLGPRQVLRAFANDKPVPITYKHVTLGKRVTGLQLRAALRLSAWYRQSQQLITPPKR